MYYLLGMHCVIKIQQRHFNLVLGPGFQSWHERWEHILLLCSSPSSTGLVADEIHIGALKTSTSQSFSDWSLSQRHKKS